LAATGAFVLVEIGWTLLEESRERFLVASAEVTRAMNSWLSLSIAALSWPIEGCQR
jgi:hypothetical protein